MPYWLVKQEPTTYAWETFVADGHTEWTGVRNNAARLQLLAMQRGDLAFYYHSNVGLEVVGLARVTKTAFQDPTADDPRWVCVELAPEAGVKATVPLSVLKADERTSNMAFIRQNRLSVSPVTDDEAAAIVELAGGTTKLPASKRKKA
jgi:predicted RNA-binding protein with PUA-like domain